MCIRDRDSRAQKVGQIYGGGRTGPDSQRVEKVHEFCCCKNSERPLQFNVNVLENKLDKSNFIINETTTKTIMIANTNKTYTIEPTSWKYRASEDSNCWLEWYSWPGNKTCVHLSGRCKAPCYLCTRFALHEISYKIMVIVGSHDLSYGSQKTSKNRVFVFLRKL